MSATMSMKQCKRPLNKEEETSSKKRRDEAVNGLDLQRPKKAPRLSPALFCNNCVIQHPQLQQLLKYAVIGKKGNATQASWCSIHHQKRLRGVVVAVLQDLSQHHFYQFYLHFHSLRRLFRHRFSLSPPSGDFITSLLGLNGLNVPVQKKKMDDQRSTEALEPVTSPDPILQRNGRTRHGLTRYLLTEKEMRKNNYPFVGSSNTENYVLTKYSEEPTDSSPLFGLDCEMCLTCKGKELTRVSLVDAQGHCIMDELVKPDNPIINYMSRFSGITEEMLLPVKTKLKDVQEKFKRLLPPDAILVGHSLNFDLQALQMIHPNVIDTSLLFAGNCGKRFRLKFLAQEILRREIQREDALGHNPVEDALAALNLAQYFIQHGPKKVANIKLKNTFLSARADILNPTSEIQQNGLIHSSLSYGLGFLEELGKADRKIAYVSRDGLKDPVPSRRFETFLCASNEEVLEKACSVTPLSPVTIVKFQHRHFFSKCYTDANEKVTCKFIEMMTVFAGPFKSGVCLKSVKMHFESCGPIHSLSTVADTCQPYICIRYSVPEGAQLAVELLNGSCINGCHIKVQRMLTRRTLDCEDIFKEMEEDPENKNTIYVSGFTKPLTEEFLQQQLSHLKKIKSIFVPTNPKRQQRVKYCYLKFHSPDAATTAVEHIRTHGGLRSMKALTSSHLHRWLQAAETCIPPNKDSSQEAVPEEDQTEIIKDLDRKINQLYESMLENTLCVILFPGNNSSNGSLPGLGLMGIKC